MTIEDQNGVDRVNRKAQWPHFLNKEICFCFVAQRVTNMRWGRRCWDALSASPGVWRRSSSSRIEYEYYHITDLYRSLRKWTIPTIDRDTETLTDQNYRYTNNMATRPAMRDVSPSLTTAMTASPKNQESIRITYLSCALWTTSKLLFSQPNCYGLS